MIIEFIISIWVNQKWNIKRKNGTLKVKKEHEKVIPFGDTEIEKHKFYCHKNPILIDDLDINKIIVSNKVSFRKKGFKYFIGYKDNEKAKPFCVMLHKS